MNLKRILRFSGKSTHRTNKSIIIILNYNLCSACIVSIYFRFPFVILLFSFIQYKKALYFISNFFYYIYYYLFHLVFSHNIFSSYSVSFFPSLTEFYSISFHLLITQTHKHILTGFLHSFISNLFYESRHPICFFFFQFSSVYYKRKLNIATKVFYFFVFRIQNYCRGIT